MGEHDQSDCTLNCTVHTHPGEGRVSLQPSLTNLQQVQLFTPARMGSPVISLARRLRKDSSWPARSAKGLSVNFLVLPFRRITVLY